MDNGEQHSLSFQSGFIGIQTTPAHRMGARHVAALDYRRQCSAGGWMHTVRAARCIDAMK